MKVRQCVEVGLTEKVPSAQIVKTRLRGVSLHEQLNAITVGTVIACSRRPQAKLVVLIGETGPPDALDFIACVGSGDDIDFTI
jgi:hypothetical protein